MTWPTHTAIWLPCTARRRRRARPASAVRHTRRGRCLSLRSALCKTTPKLCSSIESRASMCTPMIPMSHAAASLATLSISSEESPACAPIAVTLSM